MPVFHCVYEEKHANPIEVFKIPFTWAWFYGYSHINNTIMPLSNPYKKQGRPRKYSNPSAAKRANRENTLRQYHQRKDAGRELSGHMWCLTRSLVVFGNRENIGLCQLHLLAAQQL